MPESRSIAEIEGTEWPPLPSGSSPLAARCHALRRTPITQLNVSDWRILIGQSIGLRVLVPLALEVLERDPLVEAEYFRGDLFDAVLRASPQFYRERADIRSKISGLVSSLRVALENLDHVDFDATAEALEEAVEQYQRGQQ